MPALTLEYDTDAPDVDADRIKEDFEAIWSKNVVEVDIIRERNPQGGDYFHEDEGTQPQVRKIWLNIQGTQSNFYKRANYGIITDDSEYHAYARWYEDIENNDKIVWDGKTFVTKNVNRSTKSGEYVWWEFDLKRVDKGTQT